MTLSDLGLPPITFHKAAHYTQGRTEPVRAFVNHRMVGTLAGTTAYFQNPDIRDVSTHFGIGKIGGKLQIHQYVPLDDTAYANGNYDASGVWDNWGFKTSEINPQTISIEHQDHWGDADLKGIVPADVQQAAMKLWALLRYGSLAQWKAAGIRVRDWDHNGPILLKEIRAIPVDGHHVITHHDIAGKLKPYCWLPWAKDTVGYPRSAYVSHIPEFGRLVTQAAPLPSAPTTYTQAQLDAAVKAATDPLLLEIAGLTSDRDRLTAAAGDLQAQLQTLQTTVSTARADGFADAKAKAADAVASI